MEVKEVSDEIVKEIVKELSIGRPFLDENINRFFKKYNKNNTRITLIVMPVEKRSQITLTTHNAINKKNEILVLIKVLKNISKKELSIVLNHEFIHVVDYLKANGKTSQKKSYKKTNNLDGSTTFTKERKHIIAPYLNDTMEFNVAINRFMANYNHDSAAKSLIDKCKSYDELFNVFMFIADLPKTKELQNSKDFKEKVIKRLAREGVKLNFGNKNKDTFKEKVTRKIMSLNRMK